MTTRFTDHLLEGDHASRPAFGDVPQGTLYACSTHGLIYQSDGATAWSTWATLVGAAPNAEDVPFTPAGTIAATDVQAAIEEVAAEAGGAAYDPIATLFGAPDTAFEFDSSSLAGLTVIGGAAVEDADTTIPGWLYYKATDSSTAWHGRYLASPSMPFTAITRVDVNMMANYQSGALLVGVADPATGAFMVNEFAFNNLRKVLAEKFTNRTTFGSGAGNGIEHPSSPIYLAVVVNSTTSIDYWLSMSGQVWRKYAAAHNPSLTVASVGVAMKSENASGAAVAFDFLRIWNSAKTFPG